MTRARWLALACAAACNSSRGGGDGEPQPMPVDGRADAAPDAAAADPMRADASRGPGRDAGTGQEGIGLPSGGVGEPASGAGSGGGGEGEGGEGAGSSATGGSSGSPACTDSTGEPYAPVVLFVIDGSGSMCEVLGESTRWEALRSALLDPSDGIIHTYQDRVAFGVMIYDGSIDMNLALGATGGSPSAICAGKYVGRTTSECPALIQMAPAPGNADAIDALYPAAELGGSTPTHKAMTAAVDSLLATSGASPMYIVLATAGAPNDICIGGIGGDSAMQQQAVLDEVDRAAAGNITTLAVSLAGSDATLQAHLEAVADHGQPGDPDAAAINPGARDEIVASLDFVIDVVARCPH